MTHIGLERIEVLFQTWPEAFKKNFKRELCKEELLDVIAQRAAELELQEIKNKFSSFSYPDLCLAMDFILSHDIDHISSEKQQANDIAPVVINKSKKSTTVLDV
jgi:hypothetical protein